jgi:hypothetical protein
MNILLKPCGENVEALSKECRRVVDKMLKPYENFIEALWRKC